jgi:hypothetical protein
MKKTKIQDASALLEAFLGHAEEALSGRSSFNPEALRALAAPLREMEPIVAQAAERHAGGAGTSSELQDYTDRLRRLDATLEQVRFMLLARQTTLEASRRHVDTLNQWATRFNETR